MQLLPTALLLLATLTAAKPLPTSSLSLAEIERRWSTGETEVCRPNAPGCYLFAWWHSIAGFCRAMGDDGASIHHGATHRDATPAWNIQRDAEADADAAPFAYATDERTMAQRRSAETKNTALLQKMKHFVKDFYASRGIDKTGIIGRDAAVEDAAPVLKPRRGMRYAFTA